MSVSVSVVSVSGQQWSASVVSVKVRVQASTSSRLLAAKSAARSTDMGPGLSVRKSCVKPPCVCRSVLSASAVTSTWLGLGLGLGLGFGSAAQ